MLRSRAGGPKFGPHGGGDLEEVEILRIDMIGRRMRQPTTTTRTHAASGSPSVGGAHIGQGPCPSRRGDDFTTVPRARAGASECVHAILFTFLPLLAPLFNQQGRKQQQDGGVRTHTIQRHEFFPVVSRHIPASHTQCPFSMLFPRPRPDSKYTARRVRIWAKPWAPGLPIWRVSPASTASQPWLHSLGCIPPNCSDRASNFFAEAMPQFV